MTNRNTPYMNMNNVNQSGAREEEVVEAVRVARLMSPYSQVNTKGKNVKVYVKQETFC